ncbi:MAG: hypothetical protein ACLTS6_03995 [Anaerobutyricum sp.]
MMKIGYLDDEYVLLKSAIRSLKKYDIEVVALDNIDDVANITMLTDTIISDSLECLLVDYDLMKLESKVYGTQIIKDINEILPDFTCFLLTNFTEQGINEKIVQEVFVQDKAIFAEEDDSQEFYNFVNKIKNSVECFRKRLEVTKLEYEKLVEKKKGKQISANEEDRFIYMYKVLASYDYVDKMPDILVRNSTQDTLEDMLITLKELKKYLRKE